MIMNTKSFFTTESTEVTEKYLLFLFLASVFSVTSVVIADPEPKFEPQTIDGAISIGYGVAVGEVDGDGKPDILLADAKQVVWYKNPGKPGEKWTKYVMAENLTERDNVCIAARDINGDGKVEVAVGAQWNPGETTDPEKSGAIFYLIRPEDPTKKWEPVQIKPHDPTVHRMRWMRIDGGIFVLAVLPLHGRENKNGEGPKEVRLQVITTPLDPRDEWKSKFLPTGLHVTHNFDIGMALFLEWMQIAGRENVGAISRADGIWSITNTTPIAHGAGEVRVGKIIQEPRLVATIEPMHGNNVVAYIDSNQMIVRRSLDETLNQGHALAVAPILSKGSEQIVAGWRNPNTDGKVGIRMYVPQDEKYETWKTYAIDDNKMACEDLMVADLDGDGRLDIVASGRATKNVIVYWNRTEIEKK